ncbi:MAG: hypothetical protein R3Y60_02105 [bacterium]
MEKLNKFVEWAYKARGNTVKKLAAGEQLTPEKMFLSFMSHNPIFISNGPAGLNGSVKGVGFAPKEEFMEKMLEKFEAHIATYVPGDKTYQDRALTLLIECIYGDEAQKNIDFTKLYGVEMAYQKSYENYMDNSQATMVFYQPPVISYEVRGQMKLIGERHDKDAVVNIDELPLIQRYLNAIHDVYHSPNRERWKTRMAYQFTIEEIYDKSVTPNGWGTKVEL